MGSKLWTHWEHVKQPLSQMAYFANLAATLLAEDTKVVKSKSVGKLPFRLGCSMAATRRSNSCTATFSRSESKVTAMLKLLSSCPKRAAVDLLTYGPHDSCSYCDYHSCHSLVTVCVYLHLLLHPSAGYPSSYNPSLHLPSLAANVIVTST